MSWNKNTIIQSSIDNTIEVLKEAKIKYKLTELCRVYGQGLNDDCSSDETRQYPIRRLEYKDLVILEQMQRHPDCDCDDIIYSKKFKKNKEPKAWETEITLKVEGY